MSDPTLSEALAEAYASAPASTPLIHTLSIGYAGLLVAGVPGEIYLFQGYSGDRETADGVPLKDFRLEDDAPYRGGLITEFIGLPFDVTPPAISDKSIARGRIVIDGVGREIADLMREASSLGAPIDVTYRAYLGGLEAAGPQNDPPMRFGLSNVRVTATQVTGDISVANTGNRRFPHQLYKTAQFPALRA